MSPVQRAQTVDDALERLAALGPAGAPLAGGTWILRGPVRGEQPRRDYVALRDIDEMRGVARADGTTRVGALATHAEIGGIDDGTGPLGALAEAARRSAFPAVRNVATLGGNLASPFPEADLVPPLLAADADLELASPRATTLVDVAAYLSAPRAEDELIVAARIPAPPGRRSAFERVTVRAAAEYSIVSMAVSLDVAEDGTVATARVAVGAVEARPRRVPEAERALTGRPLDAAAVEAAGAAAAGALTGRDGLDAPGWYRVAVLPAVMERALARLAL